MTAFQKRKPDYGIDAPAALRNLLLIGALCLLLGFFGPRHLRLGPVNLLLTATFLWTGGILLAEGLLFLLYVKYGKFRHRDFLLGMRPWKGDEQVLDVGCGRGLLLAGAAKRLSSRGHATGLDVWSNVDMGGNSAAATTRNLELERVTDRCTLVSESAHKMPFANGSYDLVVSNLCLHNISDRAKRRQAVEEIIRVLRPGGTALISDYKFTGQYAKQMRAAGWTVERRWGSWLTTFPPLRVVVAHKLDSASGRDRVASEEQPDQGGEMA